MQFPNWISLALGSNLIPESSQLAGEPAATSCKADVYQCKPSSIPICVDPGGQGTLASTPAAGVQHFVHAKRN